MLPVSLLYGLVMEFRNTLFKWGVLRSSKFDVRLISVGNLEVGGTGKTPFVKYLIRLLGSDYNVAVLSRGYGRKTNGFYAVSTNSEPSQTGDEPLEIKRDFAEVPVCVCENRVTGVAELLREYPEVNLILLDDAFQHRYIHRDISLLLSRATRPFYDDHVLPMGRLREFRHNYKRADALIFTSAKKKWKPDKILDLDFFTCGIRYTDLVSVQESEDERHESDYLLITGLANTDKIESDMRKLHNISSVIHLSDHHVYTSSEIQKIALDNVGKTWLTTQKDWVKIQPLLADQWPFLSVKTIAMQVEMYERERFELWLTNKLKNG
jgi:tetraacyldisaccharide 4'-kinase